MSYVYFIRPIGMKGPVKIGQADWPDRRLTSIAQWSPVKLELVAAIEGGGELERRFHAKFKETYSHKEWFGWSPELEATIEAVQAGSFDVSTLPEPEWLTLRDRRRSHWQGPRRLLVMHSDGSIGWGATA